MNPLDFWKKYKSVGTAIDVSKLCEKNIPTNCRFCGKEYPEVTFKCKAHIIPELLGRNDYTSNFECDSCNNTFSKYESHLATFFRPYLSILNVKGKRKVPKFQSREENKDANSVTSLETIGEIKRHFVTGNQSDFEIDEENKTAKLIFRNESIIPKHVYKSLVRIGLAMLPEKDLIHHQKSFDWLVGSDVEEIGYLQIIFLTTLKKKKFEQPFANLYQAINYSNSSEEFPNHILILGFANQIIQVYLPFSEDFDSIHDAKKNLSLDLFPAFKYDEIVLNAEIQIKTFNISSNEKIKLDTSMSFIFKEYEKSDTPTW